MQATTSITQEPKAATLWMKFAAVLVIAAVATALAECARLYLVEPEALAQRCMPGDYASGPAWQCTLRAWLVMGFLNNVFGIASVIVGLLAIVSRWRSVAVVAMICGITGAVLYRYELSGLGILLGALTLVSGSNRNQSS